MLSESCAVLWTLPKIWYFRFYEDPILYQHFLQPNDQVVDLKLLTSWCDGEKPVLMMIYCMYILAVCVESNPSICWLCYQSIWFGHCCETLPYKKYVMVSCWRVRAIYTTVSSWLTTIFCGLLQPVSEHFCRQIVTDWSLLWSTESNGAGMRVCGRTITNELNDLFSYIQLNSTTRARPDPTGPNRTRPDPSLRQSPRTLSGRGPVGPV